MTTDNIYSAPQSNVTADIESTNEIDIFPRISAWAVFFLMIPTLGIYYYYWLYSRSKLVSTLTERELSLTPAKITMGLAVVSLIISIVSNIYKGVAVIMLISTAVSLVNLVFVLIALFSFRAQLQLILQAAGASDTTLTHVKTFFFSSIYMQYKINKCLDERNRK